MAGPETLYATLKNFGFGDRTGLDCPGETTGVLTPSNRWSKIDTSAIAFGQGMSTSAIQLVSAAAAIANGGTLMKPFIVQSITNEHGRILKQTTPEIIRRAVSPEVAAIVKRIMQTVVTEGGTGTSAFLDGYTVCGKTGTAQKTDESGNYARGKYTSSFIGFAPAGNPRLVILVVIDEPPTFIMAAPWRHRHFKKSPMKRCNTECSAGNQKRRHQGSPDNGRQRLKLSELYKAVHEAGIKGSEAENNDHWTPRQEIEVTSLHYNTRDVRAGGLFVAIEGFSTDGHRYIQDAVDMGAVAVVSQKPSTAPIPVFQVSDSRKTLAVLADHFFETPSRRLNVIGITGTNGKTTTAYLIENILLAAGFQVGVIGTVNYRYKGKLFENPVTTPESLDLQRILAEMLSAGITHVVLEVSSHAIDLSRIASCRMDIGVFTNLTQDHLDYHGDMDRYWACKKDFLPNTWESIKRPWLLSIRTTRMVWRLFQN